jgi:hypothetical protein
MKGILCMGLISVITNNFVLYYQQLQVLKLELKPKPYAAMSDSEPEVTKCKATLYICNFQFYSLTCKLRLILLSRLKSTETVTCSGYVGFWTQKDRIWRAKLLTRIYASCGSTYSLANSGVLVSRFTQSMRIYSCSIPFTLHSQSISPHTPTHKSPPN